MNPRALLARLNPSGPKLDRDINSGGGLAITSSDVAGALGLVTEEFGRELMLHMWAPSVAALSRDSLLGMVLDRTNSEFGRQVNRLTTAKLDLHLAETNFAAKRWRTSDDRLMLQQVRDRAAALQQTSWPWDPAMMFRICDTALTELTSPNHCSACDGRGMIIKVKTSDICSNCEGRGQAPMSNVQRASRLGRDEAAYRRRWCFPYEWCLNDLMRAERAAADQLAAQLIGHGGGGE